MTNSEEATITAASFQLKGGLYTLTTIQLLNTDLNSLQSQLVAKISQAPNFFCRAPVIIDLKQINLHEEMVNVDFAGLRKIIKDSGLVLVGLKNVNDIQQAAAIKEGLAILRDTIPFNKKQTLSSESIKPLAEEKMHIKPQESHHSGNRLVTTPVRSGQQIYVPGGDLIITSSVSPGAELLADGNIHVYGALRGRALAGINGNKEARIFCSSLEAELISIAGNFKISEDIEKQGWKIAAEIYLELEHLQIRAL